MKITVNKFIEGDIYKARIATSDWSQIELQKMASFGEPQIDLGGSFTGPPAFTLPDVNVAINSGSPFLGSFDVRDYPTTAEDSANVWAAEIVVRLKAAIAALRAMDDNYTDETVETY